MKHEMIKTRVLIKTLTSVSIVCKCYKCDDCKATIFVFFMKGVPKGEILILVHNGPLECCLASWW